jgi:2-polyprenyl-3-methyl-5-hydroxy-6-metoxy-1,4-benzoquinol methylase
MKAGSAKLIPLIAIAGLALCASSPAAARQWKVANLAISDEGRRVVYVDVDSLKENNGKVQFRAEEHFEHAQDTDGYDTVSETAVVDCVSMDLTVLHAAYSRAGAPVAFVSTPQEGNYYSSSSATHWLLQRICNRDFGSASVSDLTKDSGRLFAQNWTGVPSALAFTTNTIVRDRALAVATLPQAPGQER